MIITGKPYKIFYIGAILKCLTLKDAKLILNEIDDGLCQNHFGGGFLAQKVAFIGILSKRFPRN